jgi:hypothetical protein
MMIGKMWKEAVVAYSKVLSRRVLSQALPEYKWEAFLTESAYSVIFHVVFCLNQMVIGIKHLEIWKSR